MLGAKSDHFLPPVTRNKTSWAEVCRGGECDVGTGDDAGGRRYVDNQCISLF